MKTIQPFTLVLTMFCVTACTLVGYVLKANFPDWNGKQWHFWAMGVVAGGIFLGVVMQRRH